MRKIRTVKELKSPTRDLPGGLTLTVGVAIGATVADDLVRRGYAVEVQDETQTAKDDAKQPLDKLKKPELVTLAASLGIKKPDKLTVPQLIGAIEKKRGEG